jgi:hypothetical protein
MQLLKQIMSAENGDEVAEKYSILDRKVKNLEPL